MAQLHSFFFMSLVVSMIAFFAFDFVSDHVTAVGDSIGSTMSDAIDSTNAFNK